MGNRNEKGRGRGRSEKSIRNNNWERSNTHDGFRGEKEETSRNFAARNGERAKIQSRQRKDADNMNFNEANDYVRMEAPSRRGKNTSAGHFNPLSFLRADSEDGILNLPSMEYVEMDDADFSRLNDRRKQKEREKATKNRDDFQGIKRGKNPSEKFMKDFRDAGLGRKPLTGRRHASEESRSLRGGSNESRGKKLTGREGISGRKPFGQKPAQKKSARHKDPALEGERLQKVLAIAGFGSRRDCEEFIVTGRVMVDREIVTELGTRVMPHQIIHLDGELVRRPKKFVYYALNKPGNVICSNDDPDGRRRALDFIHENVPGLFAVGRLDLHSEGLLLITNDGELANRLTHPSYEVPKVYRVRVSGTPTRQEIAQICRGVHLAEGLAKADDVRLRHVYRDGTAILEMTLREGRNREIRRILAKIGHNVLDLVRISVGDVKLGKIPLGEYRPLTSAEVKSLKKLVGLTESKTPKTSVPAAPQTEKADAALTNAPKIKSPKLPVSELTPEEKAAKAAKLEEKRKRTEAFFEKQSEAPNNFQDEGNMNSTPETAFEANEFQGLENPLPSADALYEMWKAEMNSKDGGETHS
ncbi:MAG: rRNA pseudouridine synthase [Thermoguttaceae bacterium]|nr:rRNA pseudouridine synthase [Thermoguttaceae bacterium]